jgi:hypothetical protein
MTTHQSPQTIAMVEAAIDAKPRCSREIWKRIDCWSPTTVNNACRTLAATGRVHESSEPLPKGFRRVYWRAQ